MAAAAKPKLAKFEREGEAGKLMRELFATLTEQEQRDMQPKEFVERFAPAFEKYSYNSCRTFFGMLRKELQSRAHVEAQKLAAVAPGAPLKQAAGTFPRGKSYKHLTSILGTAMPVPANNMVTDANNYLCGGTAKPAGIMEFLARGCGPEADARANSEAVVANRALEEEGKEKLRGMRITGEPWIPTATQCTFKGLDATRKLVVVMELPSNVVKKWMLEIELSMDGKLLTVIRPRPMCVTTTDSIVDVLETMERLDPKHIPFIQAGLQDAHERFRHKEKDQIYDSVTVTLQETVDKKKHFLSKIFRCNDGSVGLICIFDIPKNEIYFEHESDDELVECGKTKKRKIQHV